jgi:hypothetical protein
MLRRILCSLALVALLPEAQALDFYHSDDTLVARGRINFGDAARFEAELTDDVHRLLIRSEGGVVVEGLAIAELVAGHHLRVTVDGYCASACAQYIFPAAAQREVIAGGVLLWHGAGPAMVDAWLEQAHRLQALGAPYQRLCAKLQSSVAVAEKFRQGEEAFNVRHGISAQGVRNMDRLTAVEADAVSIDVDEAEGKFGLHYEHLPRCQMWLPDAAGLAEIGVQAAGYAPPNAQKLAALMHLPESAIYTGSLFDARSIEAQCGVNIEGAAPVAGSSSVAGDRP